jgi:hypothetical protein
VKKKYAIRTVLFRSLDSWSWLLICIVGLPLTIIAGIALATWFIVWFAQTNAPTPCIPHDGSVWGAVCSYNDIGAWSMLTSCVGLMVPLILGCVIALILEVIKSMNDNDEVTRRAILQRLTREPGDGK